MKKSKKEQGVTLIALTITIIVLLILAGVTIATLTGENGILTQASIAKEQTSLKSAEEEIKLAILSSNIDGGGNINKNSLKQELDKLSATYADDLSTISYKGYTFSLNINTGNIESIDGKYLVKSRNLYNANNKDILNGVYLFYSSSTGYMEFESSNYNTTGWIEISGEDNIVFSFRNGSERARELINCKSICGYDENKNYVEGSYQENISDYQVPDNVKYIRVSFFKDYFNNATYFLQIENAKIFTYYEEYFEPYYSDIQPIEWRNDVDEYTDIAFLPKEIYVANNVEMNIYNNQVCPIADETYTFLWQNIEKIGDATNDYTGSLKINKNLSEGEHEVSLQIKQGDNVLWTGNTNIKIVDSELTNNVSVLPIGDSLTADKPWLNNILKLSNNKISLQGTLGTSPIVHEGRAGFTSDAYLRAQNYSDIETVHAFYNTTAERFDWNYYKNTTENNPDAVILFLGTNGLTRKGQYGNGNCIKQIVDYIRQDDSNIPIFVVNTIYGGTGNYEDNIECFNLMTYLQAILAEEKNVNLIPLALTHDSSNNFSSSDLTHPSLAGKGYTEFANTIYSAICGYYNK